MAQVAEQVLWHRFGRIDILINNAGHQHAPGPRSRSRIQAGRLEENSGSRTSPVSSSLARAVVPAMLQNKRRPILSTSAPIAGLVPLRLQSAFVAAKAGVVNLTRSMALELGPQGILVECSRAGLHLDCRHRSPVLWT